MHEEYIENLSPPPGIRILQEKTQEGSFKNNCWYYKLESQAKEPAGFWYKTRKESVISAWRYYLHFIATKEDVALLATWLLEENEMRKMFDPKEEVAFLVKKEKERKTIKFKIKSALKDIGIHIEPFKWRFSFSPKKNFFYTVRDPIFSFGPIKITIGW